MRTAVTAKTVASVSGGVLVVTALVAGAAVALTRGSGSGDLGTSPGISIAATGRSTSSLRPGTNVKQPSESAAQRVPALHQVLPPDAIVRLGHSASSKSEAWVRHLSGVRRLSVADTGTIKLHGTKLRAWGVQLGSIRGFTPSLTASSTPLWQSIAAGELTVGYADAKHLRKHLGATYVTRGRHSSAASLRVGAFATIGLDGAQALVSQSDGKALGLKPRRVVMVAAPKIAIDTLTADLHHAFGASAHVDVTRAAPVDQAVASQTAIATIPANYLTLYRQAAATCPGLPWTVLAGIGTVETGNGRDVHKSTAGALGPMQFLPSTWAMYGYDADHDGKANINDPTDAVFSAARYLCAAGAGRGGQSLDNAIFSYNHAWWYVREVINIANSYV